MSKFERGDRVRVAESSTLPDYHGREGDVVYDTFESGGGFVTRVRFDNGDQATFYEANLDLVDEVSTDFGATVNEHLGKVLEMMVSRHEKYGPGNIARHGELGLLVRLGDKLSRLENSQADFSDESVDDTVDDIIGYALIWKMWRAGDWPELRS